MEIWSLFSGAMGLDLGLEAAGLRPTLAVELDKWACRTIRHNRPDLDLIEGDVKQLSGDDLRRKRNYFGQVFLMTGGPPCQSFSSGGKRAALSDSRGNLIYEYLRLISEVRPTYFIFENVANLITASLRHRQIKDRPGQNWNLNHYASNNGYSSDGLEPLDADEMSGSAIRQILTDVQQLGYHVVFGILDAADYGSAQHRLRFVMLGASNGHRLQLPQATHGAASRRGRFRTVRDAIEDLRDNPGPHSTYTPEMARFFRHVPEGGNWRALPKDLQAAALGGAYTSGGGKTGFFRRLSWDLPAPTITGRANRKASAICHPEFTRPLSVWECARIQGFPDEWHFAGAASQQYLQIGNAVPTELGQAIASSIIDSAQQVATIDSVKQPDYDQMLAQAVKRLRNSARNKRSSVAVAQPKLF